MNARPEKSDSVGPLSSHNLFKVKKRSKLPILQCSGSAKRNDQLNWWGQDFEKRGFRDRRQKSTTESFLYFEPVSCQNCEEGGFCTQKLFDRSDGGIKCISIVKQTECFREIGLIERISMGQSLNNVSIFLFCYISFDVISFNKRRSYQGLSLSLFSWVLTRSSLCSLNPIFPHFVSWINWSGARVQPFERTWTLLLTITYILPHLRIRFFTKQSCASSRVCCMLYS